MHSKVAANEDGKPTKDKVSVQPEWSGKAMIAFFYVVRFYEQNILIV